MKFDDTGTNKTKYDYYADLLKALPVEKAWVRQPK